ncbi:NUDIX domain-containing protein [Metabacillus indicus]|uniref:NUDIX domain-containing protein n=1 Tax=Metabacillus indicus TaxID=246786 RepID=UPI003CF79DE3
MSKEIIRKAVGAIVTYNDLFMVVHKTKINTMNECENIPAEWDFVKGGIEPADADLKASICRELEEETGSSQFQFIRQFEQKICFEFSQHVQMKTGFKQQETTMFHFECRGDLNLLKPIDPEIKAVKFVSRTELMERLPHAETGTFFTRHF